MIELRTCHENNIQFLLNKNKFKNLVDIIPLMSFDNYFVCPHTTINKDKYFVCLKIARPIIYFKCKSNIIFKDITELLSRLKPII